MSLPANATLSPTPFKIAIPQKDIDDLEVLLRLSKLPPPTYEGSLKQYGVTNAWMKEMKAYWETSFNWRKHEAEINKLPQFTVPVKNLDGNEYSIHFIGIYSKNPDAVPLLLMHGWPGSFLEFLDIIPILAASTSPAYHIIVPSLPGYAYSTQGALNKPFGMTDVAYLMNELMVGLGFGAANGGYVAQGGDIGAMLSRIQQYRYADCKAAHVNMFIAAGEHSLEGLTEQEVINSTRLGSFRSTGSAYAQMHATRPSTIGHALASSPLALLAWVGEKLLEWTDVDPPVEKILQLVTMWWFTETFPRSIYPYRELLSADLMAPATTKPFGYSMFPKELVPTPKAWVDAETNGKLVWYKGHESGGHFAAMELPEVLAQDINEFVLGL
ncbi:hypothetical protein Q9L58_009052 [Maublancomyces gigas]|uniref:Epoxide hydrolase N-terminal domain-containing protein n=1 Tax=Discina gigas TaxID=1032678 RepID=A0ABR3G8N4_9PEZI